MEQALILGHVRVRSEESKQRPGGALQWQPGILWHTLQHQRSAALAMQRQVLPLPLDCYLVQEDLPERFLCQPGLCQVTAGIQHRHGGQREVVPIHPV